MDIDLVLGVIVLAGRLPAMWNFLYVLKGQVKAFENRTFLQPMKWRLFWLNVFLIMTTLPPLMLGIERALTHGTSEAMLIISAIASSVGIFGISLVFRWLYKWAEANKEDFLKILLK
jgi:uncharacterized membrane-anchored protein